MLDTSSLDESLLVAMDVARTHRSEAWKQMLGVHRNHPSFTTVQDVMRREIGFACSCSGERQEFRITLVSLKEMLPDARTAVQRAFENFRLKGNKARKRKQFKARVRAKALLFRYLTREQKWTLRANKSFLITGKDGHTYEIKESGCNNVLRYEDGQPHYQFCVIPKYETPIPVYDLMLGQKLMLETDPRLFLDTAVTKHIPSGEIWDTGKHIDNPDVEPPISYAQKQLLWQHGQQAYEDLEREQHEEIQRRRDIHFGEVGDLLLHDICVNDEARYDASLSGIGGLAFVLNGDLDVVPVFDTPFVVPPIENAETDACIVKLITGVPAEVYSSIAQVQAHFSAYDLCGINVLLHPETDAEWSRLSPPVWNRDGSVLGVRKTLDDRVPKGRAWYVADAETVGMVAHWYDEPKIGYALFNLNGVAIYEPNYAQEVVQETSQTSSEEARQETSQTSQTSSEGYQVCRQGED